MEIKPSFKNCSVYAINLSYSLLQKNMQKNKHIEALNLLSINDIFTLETGIFVYKLNRNQLPEVYNPLFQFNNIPVVYSISARNKNGYHYPFYSKSSTQQSTEYSGVKVWNALPNDIKSLQSKSLFVSAPACLLYVSRSV